jgi:hypothetical protein
MSVAAEAVVAASEGDGLAGVADARLGVAARLFSAAADPEAACVVLLPFPARVSGPACFAGGAVVVVVVVAVPAGPVGPV